MRSRAFVKKFVLKSSKLIKINHTVSAAFKQQPLSEPTFFDRAPDSNFQVCRPSRTTFFHVS